MPNFGVGVAILANDKVLLTQREDFETWCIPGGKLEDGESLAQAAAREIREETGLEVSIDRLVGIYAMPYGPNGGSYDLVFTGRISGGSLSPDPREVVAAGWFGLGDLPAPIAPWSLRPILDALNGVGGSAVWRQDYTWPFPPEMRREDIYHLRDESGLSRQEFFHQSFGKQPYSEEAEVST